eukprot:g8304.t1
MLFPVKTPLEKNLSEATSNQNWNVSNTLKYSISDSTSSRQDFRVIMQHIWECLSPPKPRKWRQVFKALTLLEFLVKNGVERCIDEVRDNQFKLRQLSSFSHIEEGKDRGQGVRDLSGILIQLVNDATLLQEERQKARDSRSKTQGISAKTISSDNKYGGFGSESLNYNNRTRNDRRVDEGAPGGGRRSKETQGGGGRANNNYLNDTPMRGANRATRLGSWNDPTASKGGGADLFGGGFSTGNDDFGGFSGAAPPASSGPVTDDFFSSAAPPAPTGGDGFGDFNSFAGGAAPVANGTNNASSVLNLVSGSPPGGAASNGPSGASASGNGFGGDFGSFSAAPANYNDFGSFAAASNSGGGLLDLNITNPAAPLPAGTTSKQESSPKVRQSSNPLLDLVDFDMPSTAAASGPPTSTSPQTSKSQPPPASFASGSATGGISATSSAPTHVSAQPGNLGALSAGMMAMGGGAGGAPPGGGVMNNMGMGMGSGNMMGGMAMSGNNMMGGGMGGNMMPGGGNMNMIGGKGMVQPGSMGMGMGNGGGGMMGGGPIGGVNYMGGMGMQPGGGGMGMGMQNGGMMMGGPGPMNGFNAGGPPQGNGMYAGFGGQQNPPIPGGAQAGNPFAGIM